MLFGFVAVTYNTQMLDPLDKPAKLEKTTIRIIECIQRYFKEGN